MSAIGRLMDQKRLVFGLALLLSASGAAAWLAMPREEDPQFPKRFAAAFVSLPGADAQMMERLVVEPVERQLAQVSEIRRVDTDVRTGVAAFRVELDQDIYDTETAWDEVQEALDEARAELPASASAPIIDDGFSDNETIVVAISGSDDRVQLADAAIDVRKRLLSVSGVARVSMAGDPQPQVVIELSPAALEGLNLSAAAVAQQLSGGYGISPQGLVAIAGKTAVIKSPMTLDDLDELRRAPIALSRGDSVPLEAVADVRLEPVAPAVERARLDGQPTVALGLVAEDGLDMVTYGRRVREKLAEIRRDLAPLTVSEVAFQPDFVEQRLSGLARSLLQGVLVVGAVLMFGMGLRLGIVVASVVPVVALSALGLYAAGGGILHQMSVAALVLALGLLVDNAIVVAEGVQQALDRGASRREAAIAATRELLWPLGASTGTTVAAFVPMLSSSGATADFTRAIPIVIILTLVLSYAAAVTVTPMLAAAFLKPGAAAQERSGRFLDGLARLSARRPFLVIVAALLAVGGAAGLVPKLRQEFFPHSDRQMVIVDITLSEGAHIDSTEHVVARVEEALKTRPEVGSIFSVVGRGLPRLYYNLVGMTLRPHVAQLAVAVDSAKSIDDVVSFVRERVAPTMPELRLVARRLEQGPPIAAPVEVRLYGDDLDALYEAAERVSSRLRDIEGTADVRHDMGPGAPVIALNIHDPRLASLGVSRRALSSHLAGQTLGYDAGTYWARAEATPMVVRAPGGHRLDLRQLANLPLAAGEGPEPTLSELAVQHVSWQPAALSHRNGRRVVRVTAQLAEGAAFSSVLSTLKPELDGLAGDTRWELGGLAEGSGEANASLISALPLGLALLIAFLLAEFNSYRRTLIIGVTVPLAAVGVIPGLLFADQPFGFMSMLGVVALVGIVVNNAIVLIDVLDQQLREHGDVDLAIAQGLARRVRPVLLTTVTTVAGLVPLAVSTSPLWPPLAWAMISGLVASTLLTLLVVPALYRVMLGSRAATA